MKEKQKFDCCVTLGKLDPKRFEAYIDGTVIHFRLKTFNSIKEAQSFNESFEVFAFMCRLEKANEGYSACHYVTAHRDKPLKNELIVKDFN